MKWKEDCYERTNRKVVVLRENKSTFVFQNPLQSPIELIKVDACQISSNAQIKCDHLALVNGIEYYIELKGQDIKHAVAQIINTIELLSADKKILKKKGFVIATRYPRSSPKPQGLRKQLHKNYNCSLSFKTTQHKEKVS